MVPPGKIPSSDQCQLGIIGLHADEKTLATHNAKAKLFSERVK
jgi:hypothetical protein